MRKMLLKIVDTHSKWILIEMVSCATLQVITEHLQTLLAIFEMLIINNGNYSTSSGLQT